MVPDDCGYYGAIPNHVCFKQTQVPWKTVWLPWWDVFFNVSLGRMKTKWQSFPTNFKGFAIRLEVGKATLLGSPMSVFVALSNQDLCLPLLLWCRRHLQCCSCCCCNCTYHYIILYDSLCDDDTAWKLMMMIFKWCKHDHWWCVYPPGN